jgi:nucleoside-diphosphate-sugar epimerase
VIPNFFMAACAGRQPVVYGDGTQSRDFTFVRNVAEANLRACEAELSGPEALNIACGEATSLLELIAQVGEIAGRKVTPRFEAPRPGDVKHSLADISRARARIGYRPAVGLREGLRIAASYYREQVAAESGAR